MSLLIVMYHYVRDTEGTRFPGLKGMSVAQFQQQLAFLCERYEMATLESALAYIDGGSVASRPQCLLTFDDGLIEHSETVTPLLAERGIQGLFFLPTASIEERAVLPVHKNHLLMAYLGVEKYRDLFHEALRNMGKQNTEEVDEELLRRTYRWDDLETARFKYQLNYALAPEVRDRALALVFQQALGDEVAVAQEFYVGWREVKSMQAAGMSIGGHTHDHVVLSSLSDQEQEDQLIRCTRLIQSSASPQSLHSFSYPYGKDSTFNARTIELLQGLGYACAFTSNVGENEPGANRYRLARVDPKDVS